LLGDGANGTLLAEWGFNTHHYDFANVLAPELVKRAHHAYFDAGAEFVETNTFQANKVRLSGTNADLQAINIEGAKLAR
jgi:homocysteine S-methyltransferase